MKFLLKANFLLAMAMIFCYSTATAQGYVFTEPDNGVTVIEAEHYYDLIEGSAGTGNGGDYDFSGGLWSFTSDNPNYTGDGYMAAPSFDGGIGGDDEDILNFSPGIRFKVNFTKAEHHYWYARVTYDDGSSDSYHLGMGDTILFRKMNPWTQVSENYGQWGWNYNTASGAEAIFNVPEAGEHDLVVYMREPNFKLDKIVILTEENILDAPAGLDTPGPDETAFTGVNDTYLSRSLRVFPNPAENFTFIRFEMEERGHVNASIFNLSGQLVTTLMDQEVNSGEQALSWEIDRSKVSAGVYYLRIAQAEGTAVRKIIVH